MTSVGYPVAVVVTGMSGTGKSTVLVELARGGPAVIDTDDPGWTYPATTPDGPEPLWDLDRLRPVLAAPRTRPLVVAGCVVNQASCTTGSTVEDRHKIARDVADPEPALRAGATHEIDACVPVADVVTELERVATWPVSREW